MLVKISFKIKKDVVVKYHKDIWATTSITLDHRVMT